MWVDLLCCHNFGAQENTNRKEPERRKPSSTSTRFSSTAAGAAHSCVPTDILGNKHKATTLIPDISCLQRALPQPRSAAFLWLSDANFYFQPQIISSWSILTWFSSSIVLQLKEHYSLVCFWGEIILFSPHFAEVNKLCSASVCPKMSCECSALHLLWLELIISVHEWWEQNTVCQLKFH